MKRLLLVLAILVIAAPAFAGTWADGYTWSAQKYGGSTFLNTWGVGLESNAGGNYSEWVLDRTGNYQAQHDVLTPNGSIKGKSKWRTDRNSTTLNAAGPGLDYTQSLGLCIGFKIGGSGSNSPAVGLRNSLGGMRLNYNAAGASVLGVNTNWLSGSANTIVDGITGNWAQAAGDWSYLEVVMNADDGKTWNAYLNGESNHMWGHATGDTGGYMQFGFLDSVTTSMDATYDFVAFGTGDANIGAIPQVPEPASLVALCTGLVGLIGLRRKK